MHLQGRCFPHGIWWCAQPYDSLVSPWVTVHFASPLSDCMYLVLNPLSCYTRTPSTGWLIKIKLFLTALEPEKLKTKFYQKTQCLVRAHFLVHRWPTSCFVLTRQKGRGSPLESLIRTLIPLMRTLPSWPNHLSKTPPPKTIRLRGRFQHMDFGGTQTFSPEHTSRATLYFSWCLP